MNSIKKIFAVFLIFTFLFSYSVPSAYAVLGWGEGEGIASAITDAAWPTTENIFEKLNIAPTGLSFLTEFMNTFKAKDNQPEVDIFFSPKNPEPGKPITAKAYPTNFKDTKPQDLYFTWYLKHNDGSGKGTTRFNGKEVATEDGNIDYDQDGEPKDIDDYKIEAMRLIANGGWDSSNATYNGDSDNDDDGVKSFSEEITDGLEDDGIETRLAFGGLNVTQPENGYRCYARDPEDGIFYEIIDGDVSEENQPPTTEDFGERGIYDFNVEGCDICGEGEPATIKTCSTTYTIDDTCAPMDTDNNLLWFGTRGEKLLIKIPLPRNYPGCSVCVFCGGSSTETACGVKTGEQVGEDDPGAYSGEDSVCTHLFPHAKGFTTGDGKFTDDEEKFWGTNPEDPDTNGDGISDEASIAGIGTDTLKWTYSPGDEVGVVVEGQSGTTTKYLDGGYMVMWALPKNNINDPDSGCRLSNKNPYMVTILGIDVEIPSANLDLEKCLTKNFVNPLNGNHAKKLNVEVSSSSDNPNNNPNGNGDLVTFTANVSEATSGSREKLYYKWTVEESDEPRASDDGWIEISKDSDKRQQMGIKYLEKLDLNSLNLNMNLRSVKKYLKVSVRVEEQYDKNITRVGTGSTIIRVNSSSSGGIRLSSNTSGKDICANETPCPALNYQILTASLPSGDYNNYSWMVNGKSLDFTNPGVQSNNTKPSGSVNFPVVGNPGDIYTITVVANDIGGKNEGNSITETKTFKIVAPSIKLNTSAGAKPKVLGEYLPIDGEDTVEDVSKTQFEGTGGDVVVTANPYPSWMTPVPEIKWTVNGMELEETGTSITLSENDYPAGTFVNVSATSQYSPDSTTRSTLREGWQVSQFTSTETTMSDSISIRMGSTEQIAALQNKSKLMANVFSGLSGQLNFIFRISLTVMVILTVSSLAMSFERSY